MVSLNGFNDLSPLFVKPPKRELPEGVNRNLEQSRAVINFIDQGAIATTALIDMLGAKSLADTDQDENEEETFEFEEFDPFDRTRGRPTSFDEKPEENTEAGAAADAYAWANIERMNALSRMIDIQEPQPVHVRSEFARWYFEPSAAVFDDMSVLTHIADLSAEVLICQETHNPHAPTGAATDLRAALDRVLNPPEYWTIPAHAWSRPLDERPEVWLQVARFFNDNLYNFDVSIGPSVEVDD